MTTLGYLIAADQTQDVEQGQAVDPEIGALIAVLVFGAVAIGVLGWLTYAAFESNKWFVPTFAKTTGLIVVAVGAISLGFFTDDFAAAYALLGTVAGYLAGAKATGGTNGPVDRPRSEAGGDTPQLD